jgi:hypothetical protein
MKTTYLLFSALLTIALTLPMFGRHNPTDTTRTDTKQPDLSSMMGTPTADSTVGGLRMKVWLMTEEQHKENMMVQAATESEMGPMTMTGIDHANMKMAKDMKGMPYDSMWTDKDTVTAIQRTRSMNKAMADSTVASTHHIVLDVTEMASGKEIAGTSAMVLIESPSRKSSSVDLTSMTEHFGSALTLNEKGEYRFTVNVSFGGVTKTTKFLYAVK